MRAMRLALAIGFSGIFAFSASAQQAPGGERIYNEHCARCHDAGIPLVPQREALNAFSAAYVENSLSTFAMRSIGEGLSHVERRAVAEFAASEPGALPDPLSLIPRNAYCSANPNVANPLAGPAWNGWSPGLANSRMQSAEAAGMTPGDVAELQFRWAFGIPGVASSGSQTTIAGQRVFVGARNGMLYSLDKETGCLAWAFEADGGIRSTPVVDQDEGIVFFGDAFAQVYALNALTGELLWKVEVDDHEIAMITAATTYYNGRLFVPVSSIEESPAVMPNYECCTFRGSLVALDADDGGLLWKTRTISRGPEPTGVNSAGARMWGPSGAAIWSAPTLDVERNRAYVATGDNYSGPAMPTSDAIMAFDLDSGAVVWTQQTLPNDVWNLSCLSAEDERFNCPDDEGPDYDFGSSPVLAMRSDGSSILLAGQKSGVLYGLDPDDGELLWETRVGDGGVLGGIEWGFAADGNAAYVAISEAFEKQPGDAGGLSAIDLMDGSVIWEAAPSATSCENRTGCNTAQPAAVSAIPGVVFSGSLDGHLRAYDAASGEVIWDYDTVRAYDTVNDVPAIGGAFNGPGASVAGGMVFVSPGYGSFGMMPGNVLIAFGVDD
ncbi:MAG: PQQ-binding-like beta-propeller repeat protein [Gammaproteobacteria bacterium]|jgi:polyvinyl alcohol dehydrogenase (cytochrome)